MVCSTFLACCPWDLSRPDYALGLVIQSADGALARQPICEFLFSRTLHSSRGEHSVQSNATLLGIRVLRAVRNVASLVESLASHSSSSDDQLAGARPGHFRGHSAPAQESHSASFYTGQQESAAEFGISAVLFHRPRSKRAVHLLEGKTFFAIKQEESILGNGCDCPGCTIAHLALGQTCSLHSVHSVARGECDWCKLHRHAALVVALETYLRAQLFDVGESAQVD